MSAWLVALSIAAAPCPATVLDRPDLDLCAARAAVLARGDVVTSEARACVAQGPVSVVYLRGRLLGTPVGPEGGRLLCSAIPARPVEDPPATGGPAPAAVEKTAVREAFVPRLRGVDVTEADLTLATRLVAAAAARRPDLDVTSGDDLADMVAAAEQALGREQTGCDAELSCLSEIAGALGAQHLITGTLARLDQTVRLSLQLLDADDAAVVGRAEATVANVFALRAVLDDVMHNLLREDGDDPPVEIPPPHLGRRVGDPGSVTGGVMAALGAVGGGAVCGGCCAAGVTAFSAGTPGLVLGSIGVLACGATQCGVPLTAGLGAAAGSLGTDAALGYSPSFARAGIVALATTVAGAALTWTSVVAMSTLLSQAGGDAVLRAPLLLQWVVTLATVFVAMAIGVALTAVVSGATAIGMLYLVEDEVDGVATDKVLAGGPRGPPRARTAQRY